MALSAEQINSGSYLETTNVWEIECLQEIDVTSPEFKDLLVRLYQNINTISLAVNIKESGYYDLTQFVTGQQFFPNPNLSSLTAQAPTYRQTFRKVINFGALPNSSAKSVSHEIDIAGTAPTQFTFTRIYATASDTTNQAYIPIPYAAAAGTISIDVDATNVTITTTSNRTNFDTTYVVLEYLKQ